MKKAIVGILSVCLALNLTACGYKYEADLKDYMVVTFTGEDGNGRAQVEIDKDKLSNDLCKEEDSLLDYFDMEDDIELYVTPDSDLKNGDVVKVGAKINSDKNGKNRLLLTATEQEITVSDLE